MRFTQKKVLCFISIFFVMFFSSCMETGIEIEFSMHFDTNGGEILESVTYDGIKSFKMPNDPIREGYAFLGWFWDNETFLKSFTANSLKNEPIKNEYTIYAKWQVNTYQITFESNGGTPIDGLTLQFLESIHTLSIPSKEGYMFLGWFIDETLETPFDFDVMPSYNIVVFASWEAYGEDSFTIDFIDFDGKIIKSYLLNTGDDTTHITIANPIRIGYTFINWDRTLPQIMPDHHVILQAVYQINHYQITFDTLGGSTIQPVSYVYLNHITPPEEPTKSNHLFIGWFLDATYQLPYTFSTMPAYNFTLFAKWEDLSEKRYVLAYMGLNDVILKSTTFEFGENITHFTPPTVSQTGYTFIGWDQTLPLTMPAHDIYIRAIYEANLYTITFETNGGSSIEPLILEFGTRILVPDPPYKEEHTFVWWFSDEALTIPYTFLTMPAKNITVYAKWLVHEYHVTFETNGGLPIESKLLYFNYDLNQIQPHKTGDLFAGWYLEPTFETKIERLPADDIVIYAKWLFKDFNMVSVGQVGISYKVPLGPNDNMTGTVLGGYMMSTSETTYDLWYEVRIWGESNGYVFNYFGKEGNLGEVGAKPTINRYQPVTHVSWRDVIVWTNAFSEMTGLNPVYRLADGSVLKNARLTQVDLAIATNHNGYRLPTSNEWEMAARWRNTSGEGSILLDERYWTPGSYASGARALHTNLSATNQVAWYTSNSNQTQQVMQKLANHLGLFDMSGNVAEWTFTLSGSFRVIHGGSYLSGSTLIRVGYVSSFNPLEGYSSVGFRVVRSN